MLLNNNRQRFISGRKGQLQSLHSVRSSEQYKSQMPLSKNQENIFNIKEERFRANLVYVGSQQRMTATSVGKFHILITYDSNYGKPYRQPKLLIEAELMLTVNNEQMEKMKFRITTNHRTSNYNDKGLLNLGYPEIRKDAHLIYQIDANIDSVFTYQDKSCLNFYMVQVAMYDFLHHPETGLCGLPTLIKDQNSVIQSIPKETDPVFDPELIDQDKCRYAAEMFDKARNKAVKAYISKIEKDINVDSIPDCLIKIIEYFVPPNRWIFNDVALKIFEENCNSLIKGYIRENYEQSSDDQWVPHDVKNLISRQYYRYHENKSCFYRSSKIDTTLTKEKADEEAAKKYQQQFEQFRG